LTPGRCFGYPRQSMTLRIAERAQLARPFLAMEVMERAFAMERAGTRVLHLEIGEPDFAPPAAAVEACASALRRGETRYTDSRGLVELREAIAADYDRRFGVAVDPGRVVVTSGTSPAMLLCFSLLVEPGDEVVLATPHYPCYPNFIRYCGGAPVFVASDPERGYPLEAEAVRAVLTDRTRAIVVASPANPTGAVQSAQTLRELAALGVPLVSDEIYDGLVYDGARVTSALEVSDEAFVLDGFSKRYAMTGFRLGWLVAPEAAVRPIQTLQQSLFISANRFVQHAGIAALREGEETVVAMRAAYARRRSLLADGLRKLGFGVPTLPQGAFYVFADARRFGKDSLQLAFELLARAQVGSTPGIDFGEAGEGWLRFCYAASEATIEEALERLADVLPALASG
jgi:aspartate/methionine/tyrosine aminotransferase